MLCVCHTTPTQKLFYLYVFRQAGPPQRVDCLAQRWELGLSVFPKDTATRYRIVSRTKVLQPFDYYPGAPDLHDCPKKWPFLGGRAGFLANQNFLNSSN